MAKRDELEPIKVNSTKNATKDASISGTKLAVQVAAELSWSVMVAEVVVADLEQNGGTNVQLLVPLDRDPTLAVVELVIGGIQLGLQVISGAATESAAHNILQFVRVIFTVDSI